MGKAKILAIALIITVVGCSTTRPRDDAKMESVTGNRTMLSGAWCGFVSACIEEAANAAKEDCAKEGKIYEYVTHTVSSWQPSVSYKCLAQPTFENVKPNSK